jgi:hypothetical protein
VALPFSSFRLQLFQREQLTALNIFARFANFGLPCRIYADLTKKRADMLLQLKAAKSECKQLLDVLQDQSLAAIPLKTTAHV